MHLSFLGAAREVTGSCFLVEGADVRFLVDCGMVQGGRKASERNRAPFAFDPKSIDFVLLTHAHIDHSGLLPKLTREGFSGPIYTTDATADLLDIMLPDSAHIQEYETERDLRYAKSAAAKRAVRPPLYTMPDAIACLEQVRRVAYDQEVTPDTGVRCRFRDAGHILGSAIIELWVTEGDQSSKLVFSGDMGQPGRPIVRDPTIIEEADILVIESTYGDRAHKNQGATEDELVEIINRTLNEQKGNVIIPAFTVGRTQEILYHLHRLTREGRLSDLNIFVDSPMATEATLVTGEHMDLFDAEAKDLVGWRALGKNLPKLRFIASVEESQELNQVRSGAVVISASGMCNAGRIKHHLRHNLPRRECSVLITGFQAIGTLGRRLVNGDTQVRIFGDDVPVRAGIYTIGGLSAHADQPALLAWAAGFRTPPKRTYVVHGEPHASLALAERLRSDYGWHVAVPEHGQREQWTGQASAEVDVSPRQDKHVQALEEENRRLKKLLAESLLTSEALREALAKKGREPDNLIE